MSTLNGWQIGLIAWYVLSAFLAVAMIGKPRKPVTLDTAAVLLVIYAFLIFVVVRA